jgi:hypothetical protein
VTPAERLMKMAIDSPDDFMTLANFAISESKKRVSKIQMLEAIKKSIRTESKDQ